MAFSRVVILTETVGDPAVNGFDRAVGVIVNEVAIPSTTKIEVKDEPGQPARVVVEFIAASIERTDINAKMHDVADDLHADGNE